MSRAALITVLAAALAPVAAAEDEPSLNESDYDTTDPPADDSYLDDSSDLEGTGVRDSDLAASRRVAAGTMLGALVVIVAVAIASRR